MPPQDSERARWFAGNLLPHEPMLRAWLRRRFPSVCDVDDIIQESYLRVLHAREAGHMKSPKAFLFVTARNFALNRIRDERLGQTESLAENENFRVMDTSPEIPEELARAQELELLKQAIQSLPPRCRQIITLRKIYGLSQKETAEKLGIAEHTVEAQSTIALRKLTDFFKNIDRHTSHEPRG